MRELDRFETAAVILSSPSPPPARRNNVLGAISDRQIEFENFDRNQTDLLPLYFLVAAMLAHGLDDR